MNNQNFLSRTKNDFRSRQLASHCMHQLWFKFILSHGSIYLCTTGGEERTDADSFYSPNPSSRSPPRESRAQRGPPLGLCAWPDDAMRYSHGRIHPNPAKKLPLPKLWKMAKYPSNVPYKDTITSWMTNNEAGNFKIISCKSQEVKLICFSHCYS